MKRNNKKGFTIVELVIVIAVIAILSAVLIPTFGGIVDKANKSSAEQAARNGYTECYALDMADGVLDGYEGTPAADDSNKISDTHYSVDTDNNVATYEITVNGWTASFDGTTLSSHE